MNDEMFKELLKLYRNAQYGKFGNSKGVIIEMLREDIKKLEKELDESRKYNIILEGAKYTAQQEDIDLFVREERFKILDELSEWVSHNYTINVAYHEKDKSYETFKTIYFEDINKKLMEMMDDGDGRIF